MRTTRLQNLVLSSLWLTSSHFLMAGAFRSSIPLTTTPSITTQPTHRHLGGYTDDHEGAPEPSIRSEKNIEPRKSSLSPSSTAGFWDRRKLLATILAGYTTTAITGHSQSARAIVTDETDNFADNYWTSSDKASSSSLMPTSSTSSPSTPSDEVVVKVSKKDLQSKDGMGLELGEVEFRTNRRVFVKSVTPGLPAERMGIQKDWIVVSINGETAERTNVEGVAIMIYRAARSTDDSSDDIEIRFRNPVVFQNQLKDLSSSSPDNAVTTQVAPAGDTTQRNRDGSVQSGMGITEQSDQTLSVSQLIPPKMCKRGATEDDLLEISYIGRVLETGAIFDGSAIKINGEGIAGRGNDVSIFFVLGKQPFGQFPPGWDVGLSGICVGERRRLLVPPVLAYGSKGLPRRGIPPNATLQYDVTLVSLNGLAMPQ